jgi:orotidine-5'-phosphate decarboxylase
MEAKNRIIVALDVNTVDEALKLTRTLAPHVGSFKIGLQFITAMLARLIAAESDMEANFALQKVRTLFDILDGNIFWDGKFADIPNTVGGASDALTKLDVKMFNVHASAGIEAMQAAVSKKGQSILLAVTALTSLNEKNVRRVFGMSTRTKVLQFARDAKRAGCDGIVCSPQELIFLRQQSKLDSLLMVTPGIRPENSPPDDQKRTMTAAEAIKAGADYLVIGRPITAAADPVAAAKQFAAEIA